MYLINRATIRPQSQRNELEMEWNRRRSLLSYSGVNKHISGRAKWFKDSSSNKNWLMIIIFTIISSVSWTGIFLLWFCHHKLVVLWVTMLWKLNSILFVHLHFMYIIRIHVYQPNILSFLKATCFQSNITDSLPVNIDFVFSFHFKKNLTEHLFCLLIFYLEVDSMQWFDQ